MSIEQQAKLEAQKLMAELGLNPMPVEPSPAVVASTAEDDIHTFLKKIKQLQYTAQTCSDAKQAAQLIRQAQQLASLQLRNISQNKEKLRDQIKSLSEQYQLYEKVQSNSQQQPLKKELADNIKQKRAEYQQQIKHAEMIRDQFNSKKPVVSAVKKAKPVNEKQSDKQTEKVNQLIAEINTLQLTGKTNLSPENIRLLASRIANVEQHQRHSREQINQLTEAKIKYEWALARSIQAKDNQKQRHANDEQLKESLTSLIEAKENQQRALLEELEILRLHSEQEAALLRTQRDAAKAMTEKQIEDEKYQLRPRKPHHVFLMGTFIGLLILVVLLAVGFFFTPLGKQWQKAKRPTTPAVVQPVDAPVKTPKTATAVKPSNKIYTFSDSLHNGQRGPLMLALPEGSFMMGAAAHSPLQDVKPQFKASLPAFAISQTEITFNQYRVFAIGQGKTLPSDAGWGREDRPVINVSWPEAVAYTEWLSIETGHQYRLPSEREWEYAARAGNDSAYGWGDELKPNLAVCAVCGSEWDNKSTAPVGQFYRNDFGLYDMVGNVMEWTITCYHPTFPSPPHGANREGACQKHRVRGSAYDSYPADLDLAVRKKYSIKTQSKNLGFRVVRVD